MREALGPPPRECAPAGNRSPSADDYSIMECSACREVLSAHLDDEAAPAELERMRSHLASCAGCQAYEASLGSLSRAVRVRAAEPVPDLSAAIVAQVDPTRSPVRVREWARYGLVVIALTQLLLALPELLLGANGADGPVHLEHHLGAWDVALAVGLLVAAWQPERARGLLPMALALGGILVATSCIDVIKGSTLVLTEAPHALELTGVVLLWLLTKRPRARRVSLA
jgi:predicted anti-sigma-YlaC factor YlaD